MADIDDLARRLAVLEGLFSKLQGLDVPNQALDTVSSVTHDRLMLGSATGAATGDLLASGRIETAHGTWTPTFKGSGTAGVFTYTNQVGTYVQIGKIVFIYGRVTISVIGTPPTGNMTIEGLPFTSETSRFHSFYFGNISQFKYTAASLGLEARVVSAGTSITLLESFTNAAVVAVPAANFTNAACDLIFNGWYAVP